MGVMFYDNVIFSLVFSKQRNIMCGWSKFGKRTILSQISGNGISATKSKDK